MTIHISHSNGRTESHDTAQEAWASIMVNYPEAYVMRESGQEEFADAEDLEMLTVAGFGLVEDRALVWEDEDASEDDDGSGAVASITMED